ncbi:unnamed protein product [Discosporangium mesarthrocarpum]
MGGRGESEPVGRRDLSYLEQINGSGTIRLWAAALAGSVSVAASWQARQYLGRVTKDRWALKQEQARAEKIALAASTTALHQMKRQRVSIGVSVGVKC